MTDQVVTWDQIIALAGIVMMVGSGLTVWMIKRIDKVTEAVNTLRIRDVEAEAAVAKQYATHADLEHLETRVCGELEAIKREIGALRNDIRPKSAAE